MTTTDPVPMDPDRIALLMGQPTAAETPTALVAWALIRTRIENEALAAEVARLNGQLRDQRRVIASLHRQCRALGRILDVTLGQLRDDQHADRRVRLALMGRPPHRKDR